MYVVQVFGFFAVTVTATGSLYCFDTNTIASSSGLNAVGVFMLILNLTFLLVAGAAIASAGSDTIRVFFKKHLNTFRGRAKSVLRRQVFHRKLFEIRLGVRTHGPLQQLSGQNATAALDDQEA